MLSTILFALSDRALIYNTAIFTSIFLAIVIGHEAGPRKAGFWCNDLSIRNKYYEQVVEYPVLLFFVLMLPAKMFFFVWYSNYGYLRHVRNYYYGMFSNLLFTMYFKMIVARPRPNFFALCDPVWVTNHSKTKICNPGRQFIRDYECTNRDKWQANESSQSFFSGHACQAAYASFYMIFYIYRHFNLNGFFKCHLMFASFLLSLYPALTQYLNFWHFGSDIAVGYAVGFLFAVGAFFGVNYVDPIPHRRRNKRRGAVAAAAAAAAATAAVGAVARPHPHRD